MRFVIQLSYLRVQALYGVPLAGDIHIQLGDAADLLCLFRGGVGKSLGLVGGAAGEDADLFPEIGHDDASL